MSIIGKVKTLVASRYTPRLAYTHIFIEDGCRHSMLHVQNPFSFFWPQGAPIAEARISLNDSDGKLVGCVTKKLRLLLHSHLQ